MDARRHRWTFALLCLPGLICLAISGLLPMRSGAGTGVQAQDQLSRKATARAQAAREIALDGIPQVRADRVQNFVATYQRLPGGIGRLYTLGYNHYWSRRYEEAAICFAAGTAIGDDPRFWMYRGLAELSLGEEDAAAQSVRIGWSLVATTQSPALTRALERVQGPRRHWLESLRDESSIAEPAPVQASPRPPTLTVPSVSGAGKVAINSRKSTATNPPGVPSRVEVAQPPIAQSRPLGSAAPKTKSSIAGTRGPTTTAPRPDAIAVAKAPPTPALIDPQTPSESKSKTPEDAAQAALMKKLLELEERLAKAEARASKAQSDLAALESQSITKTPAPEESSKSPPAIASATAPRSAAASRGARMNSARPPVPVEEPSDPGAIVLRGSGASFPGAIYERWFLDFGALHPEIRFHYQTVGSGAGIRNFIQKQCDFGASDAAMTDEEIAQVADGVVLLPVTAGSIALAYNIPDGPDELKLSREAYAGIFLGEITHWNDPRIAKTNPDVTLPDLPITVVRRGVSSGTTYVFTRHLAAISQAWAEGPGIGTTVAWPTGMPGKRNSDIAQLVRRTAGAIGYLETGYAEQLKLPMAALQNQAGQFVKPTPEAAQSTLGEIVLKDNLRGFVSDPKGDAAYPIVSYTWLLCYQKYDDPQVAESLRTFVKYCLTDGQKASSELGYTPLPAPIAERVLAAASTEIGRETVRGTALQLTESTTAEIAPDGPLGNVALKGAGATFPSPLYEVWFKAFAEQNPTVSIQYQSVGSGAGVRNYLQQATDFGASDAAMTDEEIQQAEQGVVMVPLTAGSISLAYNLPDLAEPLRLSRKAYSGIFLGQITNWNDPVIAECNPGITLPTLPLQVIRRGVSSGTTFVFTQHLSAISEEWDNGPGTGTTVDWPVGRPGKRNSDIAKLVLQNPGAIGYVETGTAQQNKLPSALLENQAGEYVGPTPEATQVALGEIVLPDNLRGFTADPQDPRAYPIVSYTWLLCGRKYKDPQVAAAIRKLVRYCLTEGQQHATELGFIRLPDAVAKAVLQAAESRIGRETAP